jgi:hypothetical protein
MNHKIARIGFALLIGLLVATFSYRWITNPAGREARVLQQHVVQVSRDHLGNVIGLETLEIVDAVSPNRKVGKVYVYPEGTSWAVSGYYRRDDGDHWHPYLMSLNAEFVMTHLKTADKNPEFLERVKLNPLIEVVD